MSLSSPSPQRSCARSRCCGTCPPTARELLRPHAVFAAVCKGERIAHAGAYLDGAYYLLGGTVDVRMPAAAGQPGVPGGTIVLEDLPISVRAGARTAIDAGSIFGEGSALSRYPLAADFDAATDVSCLLIRTAALRAMFDLPELAAFKAAFDRDYKERTLRAHLQRMRAVRECRRAIIETLISRAELVTFKPGKPIAAEGAPCDAFYLVRGGYVQVAARSGDADVTLTYLRVGDWTGEAALLLERAVAVFADRRRARRAGPHHAGRSAPPAAGRRRAIAACGMRSCSG